MTSEPATPVAAPPARPRNPGIGLFLVGAIVGGICGGMVASGELDRALPRVNGGATAGLPSAPPVSVTTQVTEGPIVEAVRELAPAVVTVIQKGAGRETGSGSGFVIDAQRGYIATNSHVVSTQAASAAQAFDVVLSDGRRVPAQLVGRDPETDVAVVRVDPQGLSLKAAPLGNSDEVPIGAIVVAIGSPLGEFTNSVTAGVLSAKGRRFPDEATGQIFLEDLLQTDAPISPGNSGGPLIWAAARQVIGINTLVVRAAGSEGLGFAVSSNTVRQIADELIRNGRIVRGKIGIVYQQLGPRDAAARGLPTNVSGVVITGIQAGTPAQAAGLRPGDVITKVNDQQIDAEHPIATIMLRYRPGDRVRLTVFRDGREQQVELTLGQ